MKTKHVKNLQVKWSRMANWKIARGSKQGKLPGVWQRGQKYAQGGHCPIAKVRP